MERVKYGLFFLILALTINLVNAEYGYCNENLIGGQACNPIVISSTGGGSVTNNYYNNTYINGTSYNSTYDAGIPYWYNQSQYCYDLNASQSIWWYNQTSTSGGGNMTFNQTLTDYLYSGIIWGYNMTTPFTTWLSSFSYNYNQSLFSYDLNSTYNYLWYNQTAGSINNMNYNITSGGQVINGTGTYYLNITGVTTWHTYVNATGSLITEYIGT